MFIAARRTRSRRLRAGAALLAGLIPTTLAVALLATSQDVLPVSDESIDVVFFEEAPPAAPGPANAAPPSPKAEPSKVSPSVDVEVEPESEVEPDEITDRDEPPSEDTNAPVVADLSPAESGAGDGGGGGGCETEPCDPGGCTGPDCDSERTGPTSVHWSKVTVKRQVPPQMPAAARQLGPMEQKCTVRMTIDTRGRVTHVDPIDCPPVFHHSATTAAGKWRFEPMKVDDQSVEATFLLTIRYLVE